MFGMRIPNASFPGVITTLPGEAELKTMLRREQALADAGGAVLGPDPDRATPQAVCGADAPAANECLRTIPPRKHGGKMDIRYPGVGSTVYLPCFVDGCGLALGDLHYAQGDGEVSGTAIEMDADVTLVCGPSGIPLSGSARRHSMYTKTPNGFSRLNFPSTWNPFCGTVARYRVCLCP